MKNRQAQLLLGISGMQAAGIACVVAGIQIGIVLSGTGILLLVADAVSILSKCEKGKICPECRTFIPKKSRICSECGHQFGDGVPGDKLTEYIAQEKEKELTSAQIDCDFEKIESIAVDELLAYDGDIEEFLKNRCKEEDI